MSDPKTPFQRLFVICMNRPGADHNIIDKSFCLAFARIVLTAREKAVRGEVDAVVVCSAKQGSFMAGADIEHELLHYSGPGGEQRWAGGGVYNQR